jgi:enoyl-CoA hydratase
MTNPNDTAVLLIDTRDRVRTLTLNRPQAVNREEERDDPRLRR